jgi:two-component system sensor histidine kinase ChvG
MVDLPARLNTQVIDPASEKIRLRRRGPFSALTRQIVSLNVIALLALLAGLLYLNQFRESLIEARLNSLREQADIIAAGIAYSAGNPDDPLGIDAQEARMVLGAMVPSNQMRAALWLNDRAPIADTGFSLYNGQVIRRPLPIPEQGLEGFIGAVYDFISSVMPAAPIRIPIRHQRGDAFDRADVRQALTGRSVSALSSLPNGDLIATVAVPMHRYRVVQGALLIATEAGDIDHLVRAEKVATLEWFCVALLATVLSSILLAARIARPIRKLADAAAQIDPARARQADIPNMIARKDEIGDLSIALRGMTGALLARIDAIESFAADVAHEIKNPLTSLRSAVETLARVQNTDQRDRLLSIIQDDVGRIDRLISDISAASRLDAELARADMTPVDIGVLLDTLRQVYAPRDETAPAPLRLKMDGGVRGADGLIVPGLSARLGQVMRNLIDNALSFSPPDAPVDITARRIAGGVEILVEDCGPGIPEASMTKIFDRFYSERPEGEAFGGHSGLGLSIVKRIVEAHGGKISAENRQDLDGISGARFRVFLPA